MLQGLERIDIRRHGNAGKRTHRRRIEATPALDDQATAEQALAAEGQTRSAEGKYYKGEKTRLILGKEALMI